MSFIHHLKEVLPVLESISSSQKHAAAGLPALQTLQSKYCVDSALWLKFGEVKKAYEEGKAKQKVNERTT